MIKDVFRKEFGQCLLQSPKKCRTDELKSPIVFCVDKICEQIPCQNRRCDEIVLSAAAKGATAVHCIENKDRKPSNLKLQKIAEQLQGGADIVKQYLNNAEKIRFLPVLANRRGVLPSFREDLKRKRIRLRNIKYRIRVMSEASPNLPPL